MERHGPSARTLVVALGGLVAVPGSPACGADTDGQQAAVAASVVAVAAAAAAYAAHKPARPSSGSYDPGATRYRLRLRENPVDPPGAFRCQGECQSQPTLEGYVECLSACPGFEVTAGVACGTHEVLPAAVCVTARPARRDAKDPTAHVVVGVALFAGAVVLCLASAHGCVDSSVYQQQWPAGRY